VGLIDLRRLGLEAGDVRRLEVLLAVEPVLLGGQEYVSRPDTVEAELALQASVDGLVLKLAFATDLEGPCFRCLEPARARVAVRAAEYDASHPDPGAEEELRCEYLDATQQLDLERWSRDALVLALPAKLLCRSDCLGLCPRCGAPLNDDPGHDCSGDELDERWAGLRDLEL
jgi:uncharacterized protein